LDGENIGLNPIGRVDSEFLEYDIQIPEGEMVEWRPDCGGHFPHRYPFPLISPISTSQILQIPVSRGRCHCHCLCLCLCHHLRVRLLRPSFHPLSPLILDRKDWLYLSVHCRGASHLARPPSLSDPRLSFLVLFLCSAPARIVVQHGRDFHWSIASDSNDASSADFLCRGNRL